MGQKESEGRESHGKIKLMTSSEHSLRKQRQHMKQRTNLSEAKRIWNDVDIN